MAVSIIYGIDFDRTSASHMTSTLTRCFCLLLSSSVFIYPHTCNAACILIHVWMYKPVYDPTSIFMSILISNPNYNSAWIWFLSKPESWMEIAIWSSSFWLLTLDYVNSNWLYSQHRSGAIAYFEPRLECAFFVVHWTSGQGKDEDEAESS